MSMREKYTRSGASIHYLTVEWDESTLSWADFRGKVLGATDPATAVVGSARRDVFDAWASLGLAAQPDVGDNSVHASASPFEGLCERLNWLGAKLDTDSFGAALLASGISRDTILAWTKDPQVPVDGKTGSLFDAFEDSNASDCLAKAKTIAGATGQASVTTNSAFVFIKPHAVNKKVIALVTERLVAAGIRITSEGDLDALTIEKNLLIDNHYYAIANKASLTKPASLNVPSGKQQDFATKFGIEWTQALSNGIVFNALDACAELGVGGDELNTRWAAAKDAGNLVKFGGGFYAGRVRR